MSTPKWAAGTLYPTGSLVQPLAGGGATSTAITNPGFESGSTDWTLGAGMSVGSVGVFAGTKSLACTGVGGVTVALHDASPVNPGQSITATCMYQQGAASAGKNVGQVFLRWFTSGMVQIGSDSDGSQVTSSSGGYKQSTVTAVAPATAAFVSIGGKVNRNQSNPSYFDNFAWNYAQAVAPAGLIYKAVQPTLGTSGATEPAWPATVGLTVVDNTVIWEALIATRITYEASPILLSGATEPTWPESIGDFVSDNTISWEAVPQQVIQAPRSKVVTIASSKVYAADGDIVRYCATVNPLDWTSADDAGYLPTGLNQYGSNRTAVLNTYRGNVVPFSASTFLCYQVDPDPANITLLDSMEGIGSTYQQAAHPVANDLFYLSPLGVRTVGIAAGTSNLAAGDAGAPIDPLVQAALIPSGVRPLGAYYPNQGQYWLCMRPPLPVVEGPTITGAAPDGEVGSAWPGYAYTVTPGDAPIVGTTIIDGSIPDGLSYDDAVLDPGVPSATGAFTFEQETIDQNGLVARLTDTIEIAGTIALLGSSTVTLRPFVLFGPGGTDWDNAYQYSGLSPLLQTVGLLGGGGHWLTWPIGAQNPVYSTDATATAWVTSAAAFEASSKTPFGCYSEGTFLIPANNGVYRTSDYGITLTKTTTIPAYTVDASAALAMSAGQYTTDVATAPKGMAPFFATWTAAGVAHGITFTSGGIVRYGGTRFLIAGGDGTNPKAVFTTDGSSFTAITLPTLSAGYICAAAYDPVNGRWVAGTSVGQLIYMEEADGIWHLSATTLGSGMQTKNILHNGIVFVAAGNHNSSVGLGKVVYSTDGVLWTTAPTLEAINAQTLAIMQ